MSFGLYDATVPSYLQILGSSLGLIAKAQAFCADKAMSEQELLATHFGADMLPLVWQFRCLCIHSQGAIEGAREGLFSPDRTPPPEDFPGLQAQIADSITALAGMDREEINGLADKTVRFSAPSRGIEMDFTGANFLLSFSVPNFYFHATTAYDLLRHSGVDVGKRDYLGALRLNATV